jgi:hypothetical protein
LNCVGSAGWSISATFIISDCCRSSKVK